MLKRTETRFSHVKPGDTQFVPGGLRDFFLYRDLGIAEATNGKVIAHLVKANMAPGTGTGWHRHEADFQIVIMTKGRTCSRGHHGGGRSSRAAEKFDLDGGPG